MPEQLDLVLQWVEDAIMAHSLLIFLYIKKRYYLWLTKGGLPTLCVSFSSNNNLILRNSC